jgi:hypothetical protein
MEGTPSGEPGGRNGLSVGTGNFGLTDGGSSDQRRNGGEFFCLMAIPGFV